MTDPALLTLVAAQAKAQQQLLDTILAVVLRLVRDFRGWYSTDDITAWTARIAAQVEAAQRQSAGITDAYLARAATTIKGRPVAPAGVIDVRGLRRGITHPGVYGRLADQYRYERSTGVDGIAALADVAERADALVDTDLSLAQQQQEHRFMVVHSVDGWRRILHPELSRGGSCGLCVAASDRTYYRNDLKALHDRCKCTVLPIINGEDPGQDLNRADLDALYKNAGGTNRTQLKKVRFAVHDHSELGPVLREHGQHFRTQRQARADTRP